MRCVRLYADEAGESHLEDVEIELVRRDFTPPAPPVDVSTPQSASHFLFLSVPLGWIGDWHPAPQRQWILYLAGEIEVETSDETRRHFGPGSAMLVEDTSGKGHRSWVVGNVPVVLAVVQLPD